MKMTRKQLLREVYRIDSTLKRKDSEDARDALLLLLGAWVDGPCRANRTAQIPESRRRKYMKNLRDNGVFVGNQIHAEWDNNETGVYALLLDANVALGYIARTKEK